MKPPLPATGWARGKRRVTFDSERSHCPAKQRHCDIKIIKRLTAGGLGNVGQPAAVPQGSDIVRNVKNRTAKLLSGTELLQFSGQGLDQRVDLPANAGRLIPDRIGMNPLIETIKNLRRGGGFFVLFQPAKHSHRAVEQFAANLTGYLRHNSDLGRRRWRLLLAASRQQQARSEGRKQPLFQGFSHYHFDFTHHAP